jgi:hypothetical protein
VSPARPTRKPPPVPQSWQVAFPSPVAAASPVLRQSTLPGAVQTALPSKASSMPLLASSPAHLPLKSVSLPPPLPSSSASSSQPRSDFLFDEEVAEQDARLFDAVTTRTADSQTARRTKRFSRQILSTSRVLSDMMETTRLDRVLLDQTVVQLRACQRHLALARARIVELESQLDRRLDPQPT